jgi:hypothetical protein
MSEPHSRRNNARKSAARRYQREHPGSTYTHALAQTSPAQSSTDSLARSWDAGRYQSALLSGGAAVVDASARLSEALTGRSDVDQLRLLDGAMFGQWLALKLNWLHTVGELCRGPFAMPESTLPAFDVDEPVFPDPLTDTTGLEEAGAVLAEAVQMMEWVRAGNQHPEVEPGGFGEAAAQVGQIFEWVCPASAAQQLAGRTAKERLAVMVRRRRQALRRQS